MEHFSASTWLPKKLLVEAMWVVSKALSFSIIHFSLSLPSSCREDALCLCCSHLSCLLALNVGLITWENLESISLSLIILDNSYLVHACSESHFAADFVKIEQSETKDIGLQYKSITTRCHVDASVSTHSILWLRADFPSSSSHVYSASETVEPACLCLHLLVLPPTESFTWTTM